MKIKECSGLLIRLPAGTAGALGIAGGTLSIAGGRLELAPLFSVPEPSPAGLGTAPLRSEWHIARPDRSLRGNAWDAAHEALQSHFAAQGEVFIEPDLAQEWIGPERPSPAAGLGADACVFKDQVRNLPTVLGTFAWHLSDGFSQLRSARQIAGPAPNARRIRIAHFDTGYDPEHVTFPADRVRFDLQRNFLRGEPLDDARDRDAGGINHGHGTGTLSILAGGRLRFTGAGYQFDDVLGGAPDAEIVPVRVGNSVVQFLTSSVAGAINYAAELAAGETNRVDVISMSMGGVASRAWADAVNKAYDAGVIYVAAAGNNFSAGFFGVPTRFIVYPARFRRVIAVCGVMANSQPYYGLSFGTMQGNWGPASKMATALAAYTPNMPWAESGCGALVSMDGAGTSAATPQVAAAAALYLQRHGAALFDRNRYPEPWMRIEAVRQALFSSADQSADGGSPDKLGNGVLQAVRALENVPVPFAQLRRTPEDSATLAFLRALSGLGISAPGATVRDQMLWLEATQLAQQWSRPDAENPFEGAVPDPDLPAEAISTAQRRAFLEAVEQHPGASAALRKRIREELGTTAAPRVRVKKPPRQRAAAPRPSSQGTPRPGAAPRWQPPEPAFRRLRAFAIDPSLATTLDTAQISEITLRVPWEPLQPGPIGEYLEVIDLDPASGCVYEPVRLDDPALLAQDGLTPSEGTPQFHQQMVYAVASLTIAQFEKALGRKALWRPGPPPPGANPKDDSHFVRRLRIHPHALRQPNAFYSPPKVALLFGYFQGSEAAREPDLPKGLIFTCLSHDIVAHETAHALLDGMSRSFARATNPDVHAFHEAFADIVALFQHFTFSEILQHQINSTRGALRSQQNLLGELAGQFGRGSGRRGALRDAIGKMVDGHWTPHQPSPRDLQQAGEPHARGAVLVAAVFDAFLSIYERRTADLLRLASGGTGVLQRGAIHPDLVNRLAGEAAKSAQHVLTMCIRALDYCPPLDITFGEFLRALITADRDFVADDDLHYRIAFIEAFRRRGIHADGVRTLSVESLLWRGPRNDDDPPSEQLETGLTQWRGLAETSTSLSSREQIFHFERGVRRQIHHWLGGHLESSARGGTDAAYLGLALNRQGRALFEVRSARFAWRQKPDGGTVPQLIVGLVQQLREGPAAGFEGGCTVIADLARRQIQYCVRKSVTSAGRLSRQRAFQAEAAPSLSQTYFGSLLDREGEPFAFIHQGI